MDEQKFEHLIERLRVERLPHSLESSEVRVFRRLRERRTSEAGVWGWLETVFPRPAIALGAVALALTASAATAAIALSDSTPDRSASARVALGFDSITQTQALSLGHD